MAREYTGYSLVLFAEDGVTDGASLLSSVAGVRLATLVGAEALHIEQALEPEGGVVLRDLGLAVIASDAERETRVRAKVVSAKTPIIAQEPEQMMYALGGGSSVAHPPEGFDAPAVQPVEPVGAEAAAGATPLEYALGFRDGVNALYESLVARGQPPGGVGPAAQFRSTEAATWGLVATSVVRSRYTGEGIRVAVLDTGMDQGHPDYRERNIVSQSFVPGEGVQDGHGHGTHCVGTALGPLQVSSGPRYGAAHASQILVGKVLSNRGSGPDRSILAGIQWAIGEGCRVISMSLGSLTRVGETYSSVYQNVALRALAKGTLIIAAAGNDSERPATIAPVNRPANCPSILGVGALDSAMRIAYFSNGGINPDGGEVNVAAPGVDIYSSWPMPRRYNTISGTSMATPHVAGIAALWAQASNLAGIPLANQMLRASRRLSLPVRDVGWGLVQAP